MELTRRGLFGMVAAAVVTKVLPVKAETIGFDVAGSGGGGQTAILTTYGAGNAFGYKWIRLSDCYDETCEEALIKWRAR